MNERSFHFLNKEWFLSFCGLDGNRSQWRGKSVNSNPFAYGCETLQLWNLGKKEVAVLTLLKVYLHIIKPCIPLVLEGKLCIDVCSILYKPKWKKQLRNGTGWTVIWNSCFLLAFIQHMKFQRTHTYMQTHINMCVCTCAQSLGCDKLFVTSWSVSPPGSFVHEIFQARILGWVAIFYFRGTSWPRDWIHISCLPSISWRILYHYATCHLGRHTYAYLFSNLVFSTWLTLFKFIFFLSICHIILFAPLIAYPVIDLILWTLCLFVLLLSLFIIKSLFASYCIQFASVCINVMLLFCIIL